MSAAGLGDPIVLLGLSLVLIAIFFEGFVLGRLTSSTLARVLGWLSLLAGTVATERLCAREPPAVRMVALIAVALLALKGIVLVEARAGGLRQLSFGEWAGFAAGWLGMEPGIFTVRRPEARAGAAALVRSGLARTLLGAALVLLARGSFTGLHSRVVLTALLLAGLSLGLHFGLCRALVGLWRARDVDCGLLFRAPLRAQSLGEFWGRRWNLAFSQMTALAVYRPLAARLGRGPALFAAFLASGLLHELAISVPVRAGFGLPMLYFMLHGTLVWLERALAGRGHPLAGWSGRLWTLAWLVAPLPLLFHRPFQAGILWPLAGLPVGER